MKPHMQYITTTLARKQAVAKAKEITPTYQRYLSIIERAKKEGYSNDQIIDELKAEAEQIRKDLREGDELFQEGIHSAKVSCLSSITLIISELKGEN